MLDSNKVNEIKRFSLLQAGAALTLAKADAAQPGDNFGRKAIFVGEDQIKERAIPLNAKCPCGSGKKFKRCHLGKTFEQS